jgi:hypothetical protein
MPGSTRKNYFLFFEKINKLFFKIGSHVDPRVKTPPPDRESYSRFQEYRSVIPGAPNARSTRK